MILTGHWGIHSVIVIKHIISRIGLADVVKMQVNRKIPLVRPEYAPRQYGLQKQGLRWLIHRSLRVI
jgi:hypothetical protein